jgi:hypothetical protein
MWNNMIEALFISGIFILILGVMFLTGYMTVKNLEQVKDMEDWVIHYHTDSKLTFFKSVGMSFPSAWWKGSPYEIPFNINTKDDPDGINYWSIFDPIEDNVEKYLKCFPELEGVILQVKRERKLNELI